MKKIIIPLFCFIAGGAIVYFLFPQKKDCPSDVTTGYRTQARSVWPQLSKDSIPNIIKLLKSKFSQLSDTASTLPDLDSSSNFLLASHYASLFAAAPEPVDPTMARNEIQSYIDAGGTAASVWVAIDDIMDILGVNRRIGNPNGYDGFRLYFARALNTHDPADVGQLTLVLVATRDVAGVHTDVLTVAGLTGVFNKFDPCPPPAACPGTDLFPH